MKKYSIYQLDLHKPAVLNERIAYMSWDYITNHTNGFNFKLYDKVYEGEINSDDIDSIILEELFRIFNIDHPSDFKGHSLSVSDVVILGGKKYYCDNYGWQLIN